jgi:glutamate formiminotransferase
MADVKKIVECVPNFSEGRDLEKIEKIVENFRAKKDVKLLDYSNDEDHNRLVVTVVGEPLAVKEAVKNAVGTAIELIDLRKHEGQHPRMGAVDVIPFIPIKNIDVKEAVELSKELAKELWEEYKLPIFLYEDSASTTARKNLAKVRKGQFEGMAEKVKEPEWAPDFGEREIHPSAGVTAVGARMPLVAFNVNLGTADLKVADFIAKKVRHIGGGFRYVKAMGVSLDDRGIVQVSMNLTNYKKSTIYAVVENIRTEAKRFGVNVVGTELIGLAPMEALIESAVYYLGIEDFNMDQVLESRIME